MLFISERENGMNKFPGRVAASTKIVAYTTGSPCTSISSGSTPARGGSGSLPRQLAHPQKKAVLALSNPATLPIVRGLIVNEAAPARAIEIIIVIQVQLSTVENTRPRYSFGT